MKYELRLTPAILLRSLATQTESRLVDHVIQLSLKKETR